MADILQITLPDGTTYNIKDNNALPLIGGQVTGPVTFGDSVSIDDLTVGNIIVTGNASFVQGIPWATITGAPTTISGYGITDAVTNVAYDSSTYNITKTINGTTSNVFRTPVWEGAGTGSLIGGGTGSSISTAAGDYGIAFGQKCEASGIYSIAIGLQAKATQTGAIAIGTYNTSAGGPEATAIGAIAFGLGTESSAYYAISMGYDAKASGQASLAMGLRSQAKQTAAVALGNNTRANSAAQFAVGKFNIEDTNDAYAMIVGNGTADDARSNALTVDWSGNVTANAFYGDGSTLSNLDFLPLTGGTMTGPINMGGGDFKIKYGSTPPASASLENNDIYFCTGEVVADVEALVFDGAYDAVNNKAATVSSITSRVGNSKVFYGTSASTAATAIKAVSCTDFTSTNLTPGVIIMVMFDETNSAAVADLKLNVNDTGAYSIKYIYNGSYSNIPAVGYLKANQIYHFTYDGTYWVIELNYNTNSDTVYNLYYTNPKAGENGIKRYSLFMRVGTDTWESFTTGTGGTGTSKTKNTHGFYPGKIFYAYKSSDTASGSALGNGTVYESKQIVDTRYSDNLGSGLTAKKPVYLVGTINSTDGLFYLDDNWITQTPPSAEDGKIYFYLGMAYNTYQMDLDAFNPAYEYKNGAIRPYFYGRTEMNNAIDGAIGSSY